MIDPKINDTVRRLDDAEQELHEAHTAMIEASHLPDPFAYRVTINRWNTARARVNTIAEEIQKL